MTVGELTLPPACTVEAGFGDVYVCGGGSGGGAGQLSYYLGQDPGL